MSFILHPRGLVFSNQNEGAWLRSRHISGQIKARDRKQALLGPPILGGFRFLEEKWDPFIFRESQLGEMLFHFFQNLGKFWKILGTSRDVGRSPLQ